MANKYHGKWRDLIRSLVLCRDGFSCYLCKFVCLSNHVHHIDSNPQNNAPDNLITLCPHCHIKFSKGRYKLNFQVSASNNAIVVFFNSQIIEVLRMAEKNSQHLVVQLCIVESVWFCLICFV